MRISGTGISIPIDVKVLKDFRPMTKLALTWTACSDGSFVATDRGSSADIYDADIRVYGHLADINNLVDALQINRASQSHEITLGWFASDEHIFGEDVLHESTDIEATVLNFGEITQGSWGGYGLSMKLRSLSPGFTGTASLPTLKYLDIGFRADSSVSVNKYDTYHGSFSYLDSQRDAGTFEGVFTFPITDMRNMRTFLRSTRGDSFQVSGINGVKYPWGPRRGSWPATVRCTSWMDMGMWGENFWKMRITFNEVR